MEVGKKMMGEEREKPDMNFDATELRLGLPGGGGGGGGGGDGGGGGGGGSEGEMVKNNNSNGSSNYGKRGFSEAMDLNLKLSKEAGGSDEKIMKNLNMDKSIDPAKPPAKAQVVGWPPVRSFRKNILSAQKRNTIEESEKASANGAFVKVSMDGAPYLRKVDLKMYKSYQELSNALGNMFSSFTIGNCGSQGMKDFMNETKLMDLLNGTDYVPTYEDKDGDWMLVGDVPWEMFADSCKRLRIMKGKEAVGLAPRAMEKFLFFLLQQDLNLRSRGQERRDFCH